MLSVKETEKEIRIISHLPPRLASFWRREIKVFPDEIRLTVSMPLITVYGGELTLHPINVTLDDISFVMRSLSASSMYAHTGTLCEGYLTTSDGIRAGVVGRATLDGEKISSISSVSSVVIRVPRRFPAASHALCRFFEENGYGKSVILCAAPSGGKTTALRELACEISCEPYYAPTAVIDTRCELAASIENSTLVTLSAYPRSKGIEIAVRTLSPRLIICDEASNADDARALCFAISSGVAFAASAHGSAASFRKSELYSRLVRFGKVALCDLVKKDGTFDFVFQSER